MAGSRTGHLSTGQRGQHGSGKKTGYPADGRPQAEQAGQP